MRLSAVVVAFGKEASPRRLPREPRDRARAGGGRDASSSSSSTSASPATRERLRRSAAIRTARGKPRARVRGRGRAAGLAARPGRVDRARERRLRRAPGRASSSCSPPRALAGDRLGRRPDPLRRTPATPSTPPGSSSTELGVARERRLGEPAVRGRARRGRGAAARAGRSASTAARCSTTIGGFDASFFAYLEDADLAWRARMAGWRCVLAPRAIAFHHHSATLGHGSAAKHRLVGRNRVRMLAKNATDRPAARAAACRSSPTTCSTSATSPPPAGRWRRSAGRLRGLAEWRRYRAAGRAGRRELELPPSPGLRAALARNRVYGSLPPGLSRWRDSCRAPSSDRLRARRDRLTDVDSWHEHIPFAFFAVAALRPRTIVELGTWKGDSYCAFCQAVARARLVRRAAHAVDTLAGRRAHRALRPGGARRAACLPRPALRRLLASAPAELRRGGGGLRRRLDRSPPHRRLPHLRGRCPRRRDVAAQAQRPGRAPAPRHERARARVRRLAALGRARAAARRASPSPTVTVSACSPSAPTSRSRFVRLLRRAGRDAATASRFFAALGERVAAPAQRAPLARGERRRAAGGVRGAGTGDPHGRARRRPGSGVESRAPRTPRSSGRRRTSSGGRRKRLTGCGASATGRRRSAAGARAGPGRGRPLAVVAADRAAPLRQAQPLPRPLRPRRLRRRQARPRRPALLQAGRGCRADGGASFATGRSSRSSPPCTRPTRGGSARPSSRSAAQTYPHWQLCLADDGSTSEATLAYLALARGRPVDQRQPRRERRDRRGDEQGARERRGRVRRVPRPRRRARPRCIARVRLAGSTSGPQTDVVYTDEDKIDRRGRRSEPFFKPDWSPELFRGVMYVGHLLVARRSLVEEAGGLDSAFDGVQDYELMLRLAERTEPDRARLADPLPLAEAAGEPRRRGRREAGHPASCRRRRSTPISSGAAWPRSRSPIRRCPTARRSIREPRSRWPRATVIVPTRDAPEQLGRCLVSIFTRTTYPSFSVLLVDNGTTDPEARALFEHYPVEVVPFDEPFNFSRANNLGAGAADGELLVFLNNDTEVRTPEWLEVLVEPGRTRRGRCRRAAARLPERHGPARRGRPRAPRDGRSHHARLSERGRRLRRLALLHT